MKAVVYYKSRISSLIYSQGLTRTNASLPQIVDTKGKDVIPVR